MTIELIPISITPSSLSIGQIYERIKGSLVTKIGSVFAKMTFSSKISPAKSNEPSRIIKLRKLKIDPYEIPMPETGGVTNIVFSFFTFNDAKKARSKSKKKKDLETRIDADLRIVQSPLALTQAAGQAFAIIADILSRFFMQIEIPSFLVSTIAKVTFIGGVLVIFIELLIEIAALNRIIGFLKNPIFSVSALLEGLKKCTSTEEQKNVIDKEIDKFVQNKEAFIKKYGPIGYRDILQILIAYKLELNQHPSAPSLELFEAALLLQNLEIFEKKEIYPQDGKVHRIMESSGSIRWERAFTMAAEVNLESLTKRIGSRSLLKVLEQIEPIIENLKSTDKVKREIGIRDAHNLIKMIKVQGQKKAILNIIGMLSMFLSLVGPLLNVFIYFNILILPASVTSLPSVLIWAGLALAIIKYGGMRGFMETDGWSFSFKKALPEMPVIIKSTFTQIGNFFKKSQKLLYVDKIHHKKEYEQSA
jgi:hypothetical protein